MDHLGLNGIHRLVRQFPIAIVMVRKMRVLARGRELTEQKAENESEGSLVAANSDCQVAKGRHRQERDCIVE